MNPPGRERSLNAPELAAIQEAVNYAAAEEQTWYDLMGDDEATAPTEAQQRLWRLVSNVDSLLALAAERREALDGMNQPVRVKPHPLVAAEWPQIVDLPPYDYESEGDDAHVGIYVRRVKVDGFHILVGLINHVVVRPDLRRSGLGTLAVGDALEWLEMAGIPFAALHCRPDSADFYRHLDFRVAATFPAPANRVSMALGFGAPWPPGPVEFVERW